MKRLLLIIAVSFVGLVATAVMTRNLTMPRIGHWLDVGVPPTSVDLLMVLNRDQDTRPFKAAQLYRDGAAQGVLITSVKTANQPASQPEHHETVHSILEHCQVPAAAITFLDARCASTFDEAVTLNRYLSDHPHATVCVVTNDYHTRRTRWVFRRVLGSRAAQVSFASAPTDEYNADNWWRHEEGFVAYLAEYCKFAFYLFRYGNGMTWLAGLATALVAIRYWRYRRSKHKRSANEYPEPANPIEAAS